MVSLGDKLDRYFPDLSKVPVVSVRFKIATVAYIFALVALQDFAENLALSKLKCYSAELMLNTASALA